MCADNNSVSRFWQPNEDMIMSEVPSFGAPGSLIFVVVRAPLQSIWVVRCTLPVVQLYVKITLKLICWYSSFENSS